MKHIKCDSYAHLSKGVLRLECSAAVVVVVLLLGPAFAEDLTPGHGTLQWEIEPSHLAMVATDSDFYFRIHVKAATDTSLSRQPINLSIVFDRSGSMKEEAKIGYVQQAGHLVADNVTDQDYVSFVAYNHQVHVLVPMHRVVNREYLHHRIDELHAEGQTNLSGGLLEGCAQLHKRLNVPGLHHVILLTDGLANRGVTDENSLVRLVERCTQYGISVTTIGVGTEYNESLLSRIAQAGGGRYIYVSKPDKIPEAFQQELGSLLAVVAQNAKLKVPLPTGVEVQQVYGREEPLKPGVLEIPLGDLTSGEERVMLVKLRATSTTPTGPNEFRAALTYDDIAEAHRTESEQIVSKNRVVGGRVTAKTSPVMSYARLVEALDKIALAVSGMDRKLADEVQQFHQRDYPALKQVARDTKDQDFYNKAFMFEHYARELDDLIARGALHEHNEERAKLQKELHYRRYLMEHHQHRH